MSTSKFFLLLLLIIAAFSCDKEDENNEAEKPSAFNLLFVSNNATGVSFTPTLTWEQSTDSNGGNITYDLYIQKANEVPDGSLPEQLYLGDLTTNSHTLAEPLLALTTYKWYVKANNDNSSTNSNAVFNFTTSEIENLPPNPFSLITPLNNAIDVSSDPTLFWQAAIDPENDPVVYDVYLDNLLIGVGIQTTSLPLGSLSPNTYFEWYVRARDNAGNSRDSNDFNFTTGDLSNPNGNVTLISLNAIPTQEGRFGHQLLSYNDKIWIIGGRVLENGSGFESNDVWSSSENGAVWTQVKPNTPESSTSYERSQEHQAVVFNNEMWVLNGNRNTAHKSTDGITWSLVPFSGTVADETHYSPRSQHQAVVFNNRLWIIGGNSGGILQSDVWSTDGVLNSDDEVTWVQNKPNDNSAFSPRTGHQVVAFNNKLWLIGGSPQGTAELNDVWSSTNGSIWTLVTNNAPFTTRTGHVCMVQNNGNRLWLIGGDGLDPNNTNIADSLNDVWYTDDGENWVLYKQHISDDSPSDVFTGREEFDAVATANSIIIAMGKNNTTFLNDTNKIEIP